MESLNVKCIGIFAYPQYHPVRRIPFRLAAWSLLLLFAAAIIFQLIVLAGFIPTEMVWGGRLQNEEERTVGALVSIGVLVLVSFAVLNRMGIIGRSSSAFGKWSMWLVCALFALNTIGNLLALDLRETLIFTPITLLCAILAARVAMGD